ncbi:MAG: hypothetical protein ACI9FB_004277 [Candidatus Azotimanducaceae bacterium]|jgi:hypothetical protein
MLENLKSKISDQFETTDLSSGLKGVLAVVTLLLVISGMIGYIWDSEPATVDVVEMTRQITADLNVTSVTGSSTVATTLFLSETLLNKAGGYLTNDISPPGIWMDNIPNWEFGVLVQIRDMARILRNSFSRSQSQSTENLSLVLAENQFYFNSDNWMLPETEAEYKKGNDALKKYLVELDDNQQQTAQFYARSDNLRAWLSEVETRLGSLSQRLSTSVGKKQLDMSLAGDSAAVKSTKTSSETQIQTPWLELDDVFYEARGTTWALIHLLKAVEIDFREVLEQKNALVSLQQIIRELEPTQDTLWSPIILNGSGLGMVANHSLVMGSHISRANAAIIDLRRLLQEG